MKRGRPFEPGNKLGRGRPPGSRNKKTLIIQEILDEYSPAVIRKTLALALQGEVSLLRLLAQHKMPRPQDSPVKTGRLPMGNIKELLRSHEIVMAKRASGAITPVQAMQIDSLLETRRKLLETQELANRVSALEQSQQPPNQVA